jgi:hypothetical protein
MADAPQLIFRRHFDSDVWHFRTDCTRWPKKGFVQTSEPKNGTACKECAHRAGVQRDERFE